MIKEWQVKGKDQIHTITLKHSLGRVTVTVNGERQLQWKLSKSDTEFGKNIEAGRFVCQLEILKIGENYIYTLFHKNKPLPPADWHGPGQGDQLTVRAHLKSVLLLAAVFALIGVLLAFIQFLVKVAMAAGAVSLFFLCRYLLLRWAVIILTEDSIARQGLGSIKEIRWQEVERVLVDAKYSVKVIGRYSTLKFSSGEYPDIRVMADFIAERSGCQAEKTPDFGQIWLQKMSLFFLPASLVLAAIGYFFFSPMWTVAGIIIGLLIGAVLRFQKLLQPIIFISSFAISVLEIQPLLEHPLFLLVFLVGVAAGIFGFYFLNRCFQPLLGQRKKELSG